MNNAVLGILASGRGSDLQSIIDAVEKGQIKAKIGVVLTDKPNVMSLERAEKAGIPAICIDRKQCADRDEFEHKLVDELRKHGVTLVILAGFMRILSPYFVNEFKNCIMNIHPSLLPSFGGAHAHRDVLAYGVKVSGCTVHCRGCFNEESWDFKAGKPFTDETTEEILKALDSKWVSGFSLLGGDPFEPEHEETLVKLLTTIRGRFPEKSVWAWTGRTFEKIASSPLLPLIDMLVDGPFIEKHKMTKQGAWRGSDNQRIIPLVCGKVDVIILTGGIAHNAALMEKIRTRVAFIAPVEVYPGGNEMDSLAENGYAVLAGEVKVKTYRPNRS